MKLDGKIAAITGAASGIGRALARRFHGEGAKALALADISEEALAEVAAEVGGLAIPCDVTKEVDIQNLIDRTEAELGPIDVFCSNAGVCNIGGEDAPDAEWQTNWQIHVMAHIYAARHLAPKMAERGGGYLVNTASAAGLLSHVNSATYSVTKHAAVGFAEWLAINYGGQGVKVSVLCPQAVRTAMTDGREQGVASLDGMMEAEDLAEHVIRAMGEESFLITPHGEVLDYIQGKTADYDRWIGGMQRLKQKYGNGI
ncbi:MAG: SDR family oxidoreductase [Alphaproteobacteria bacterium]|jgi:NAD(P)-dependent dehydrogenase (short-subunit alcohol dehydrogenase family)|nr:SDR family oxidoreductase [Alphaproteobacteria bacterium]